MSNSNNLQSEYKQEAITSLIIGMISISLIPFIIWLSSRVSSDAVVYLFVLPVIGIIGIIFGVGGLRSTKKNLAIAGIMFSIIGFLGLVILLLIWLGFAIGM